MSLSHLRELWKLAELARLRNDPLTRKTLAVSSLFPSATQNLERYFSYKAVPGIINPFPLNEARSKGLLLGFQDDALNPVGISDDQLNRHIVVAGTTGAGKTNWLNFLASQLLASGRKVIWLDLKNEARHLIRAFPDIWLFRIEDFRWTQSK